MADNLAVTAGSGSTIGMDEVVDGTLGTVKVGFGKIMDGTLDSTNKLIVNSSGEALVKQTSALPAGTNVIGHVIVDSGSTTAVTGTVTADTEMPAAAGLADTTAAPTAPAVGAFNEVYDANTAKYNLQRSVFNGINTSGVGITATGAMGQFDDVAPGNITENQFGPLRMSTNRNLYSTIRDAAGNERGLNVDANGAIAATVTNAGTFAVQDTVLDAALISQEATTSGIKGITAFGAVTTSKPTYTTAKSDALSLDVNGLLRVSLADTPANTSKLLVTPDSVALPANQSVNQAQVAGTNTSVNVGAVDAGTQRVVQANGTGRVLVSAGGSASSSGNNTIITAGTNKLKVYSFMLSTVSTTAVTCIFQSGASGTELWRVVLQAPTGANVGATQSVTPPAWLFATASATLLNLNLSAAQTVHWSASYYDEA